MKQLQDTSDDFLTGSPGNGSNKNLDTGVESTLDRDTEMDIRPSPAPGSRRAFLKKTAFVAGAVSIPFIVPSSVLAMHPGTSPSDRINLAVIGLGGKGFRGIMGSLLRSFIAYNSCRIVAVCDVDINQVEVAREFVDTTYGNRDCAGYQDFRKILQRPDIDAVVIATPDHWHATITIMACEAGKDVYCEKALVNNLEEARWVVDAARRYERVVQAGSQSRSNPEFAFACSMIRSGEIGEVKKVIAGSYGNPALMNCFLGEEPVPAGLDWDMWLGPAAWRPYNYEVKRNWRRWKDYGGGGISDRGAHHFDVAHWGLGFDYNDPVRICPPGHENREFLSFIYEDGTEMIIHYDMQTGERLSKGVRFIGTEGEITLDAISVTASYKPEKLGLKYSGEKFGRRIMPDNPHGTGHYGNFLDCIRNRQRPNADVEIASHSTSVCLLGNISHWLNRPLDWDPQERRFRNDAEANRLITGCNREPRNI